MRTIPQGSGAGNAERVDARIDRCANSNEDLDASQIETSEKSPYLPKPKRWVAHRKAEVVAAVRGGFMSLAEARLHYALSIEEYLSWQREIDRSGLAGLRVNGMRQRRSKLVP
jgi:hypothetical protein